MFLLFFGSFSDPLLPGVQKFLKFSVQVGTAIKSSVTSSLHEPRTKCMHFNPYFKCTVYPAKLEIKMHALSSCFALPACFRCFLLQSLLILKDSNLFLELFVYFLVMQLYSCMHAIENILFFIYIGRIIAWLRYNGLTM